MMKLLVNKWAYVSRVEEREVWSSANVEVGREDRSDIKSGIGRL